MGFSRQEHWSGLTFPSPGDLPNPGIEPVSLVLAGGFFTRTSLVAQTVKDLPAIWETQVQFLGLEDPLEKEMATHSSILAWKIPWTEEPGQVSMGSQESDMTQRLNQQREEDRLFHR